jgi:5-formyltetrahydrofolate cyclo-ligase
MPLKTELRATYKKIRLSLSIEERKALSASICSRLIDSSVLDGARVVHVFLPIERHGEIDTRPLVEYLWEKGVKVVISVSHFDTGQMSHYLYTPTTRLSLSSFSIPEPARVADLTKVDEKDIDVVITPLLCCDNRGVRVGYGRGFYDRFFAVCRRDVKRVGLSFFPLINGVVEDSRTDDIPLTHLCTADEFITFEK